MKADLYWLKTLYGLLSAPFAVFLLPGMDIPLPSLYGVIVVNPFLCMCR
jgi:hypothetical protein